MQEFSNFELPSDLLHILEQLELNGYEGYAVGGCVRDTLIGRIPQDWDVATSATPVEVKKLFPKTIDTGLQHGTVTVVLGHNSYEITTYRIEGKYVNNRKPEAVEFTSSIEADLGRRDFTINAMAFNPAKGILDPFGGLSDIQNKQIKAVGKAELRFEEDALRMLRAVRFSAQLGYTIEAATLKAIKEFSFLIKNISSERIRDELNKTLLANPMSFELLHSTGILQVVLPELDRCFYTLQNNPHHVYDVGRHSLQAALCVEKDALLRWTMLLHDLGKPDTISADDHGIHHFYMHSARSAEIAKQVMQRLRFDNTSAAKILKLITEHDRQIGHTDKSLRKAIAAIGADLFQAWLKVRKADILAQNPEKAVDGLEELEKIETDYKGIISNNHCLELKNLAVSGKDLLEIGIPQGKPLGATLQLLLETVLESPELNQRSELLKLAAEIYKRNRQV